MLIYNNKCPTINHSYHYHIHQQLNPPTINPLTDEPNPTYTNISFTDYKHDPTLLEERRHSHYIYYTLNSDLSYDLINSYTPEELTSLINDQKDFIKLQLETLLEYKHISPSAAKITEEQYTNLLFINWLAFDMEYVNDILHQKQNEITNDIITEITPPHQPKQPNQTYEINTDELKRLSWYSPYVTIDWKKYHLKWQDDFINDKSRFIYILWSRQIWKSTVTSYVAYEQSFLPNQRILVSSFSANSTNNMRDYILEFAENTPPLPNWQPAFTFHAKEAFLINNITKSKIFFRTLADEWKWIRWMKLNLVIIDEAAFVANEIYERVLRPTTTTTKWRIIALSTPEKKNWYYEAVMNAMKNKDNPDSNISLYEVDYKKNPFIYADPELLSYIEENKHKSSVRQEYMCEFAWEEDEIFNINFSDFYPQLKQSQFYVLAYDPARKWKDRAWYLLSYIENWKVTSILSWAIPQNMKESWWKQALFLKEIQDKYNAKMIMDVTWVWDWVIAILKQYWLKIHMAINYTTWVNETLDKTHPYGSTKCYKVWKSLLINKTIDFCDEKVLEIYEYTNKELLKEIWQLSKIKNGLWQVLFTTSYFDDITNALLLNIYYIYQENLLSKRIKTTKEFDPYDKRTHYNTKNNSRIF